MMQDKPVYKEFAWQNCRNMTPAERHLWYDFLRTYPIPFVRQKRIENYIADFYCHRARLVIELDGGQHYSESGRIHDAQRTDMLERLGILVIRYLNHDVFQHFDEIAAHIDAVVQERIHLENA